MTNQRQHHQASPFFFQLTFRKLCRVPTQAFQRLVVATATQSRSCAAGRDSAFKRPFHPDIFRR